MKKATTLKSIVCMPVFLVGLVMHVWGNGNTAQSTGHGIAGKKNVRTVHDFLRDRFSRYEIVTFNPTELSRHSAARRGQQAFPYTLQLGSHTWEINLREIFLTSDHFTMRVLTTDGIEEYPLSSGIHTYAGFSNGNTSQTVRLTVGENYFAGLVNDQTGTYIIEPLTHYFPEASVSEFILFRPEDVTTPALACGHVSEVSKIETGEIKNMRTTTTSITCHTVEYAMALDYQAYKKMGSPANTQTILLEMLNVTNLMNEIYSGMQTAPAPHTLTYRLSEIFVEKTDANVFKSSMNGGVPNADTILAKFGRWVIAGGFVKPYGIATIWTSRGAFGNLNDLTFGFAINGLVMNPKPNLCHSNAVKNGLGAPHNLVKWGYFDSWGSTVLAAHEIGHNLSADHNGQAATPSNPSGATNLMTNGPNPGTWRLISYEYNAFTTGLNDAMNYGGCLKSCDAVAPEADYITINGASSTSSSCSGHVAFVNRSTGASSWVWNFGDGSTSSTERDPVHTYMNPGSFTVTLQATSGTQTVTKTGKVIVNNVTNTGTVSNAGMPSTAGSGLPAGLNDKLMYFNVFAPVLLKTVTVPVNMTGYITIEIYDMYMKTIFKKTATVSAGDNKIIVNAELPTGNNYSIGLGKCTIGMIANRSNTGLAFPYNNSGPTPLISITKSNNDIHGGTSALIYYYFYNWEVQPLTCLTDPTGITDKHLFASAPMLIIYPNPLKTEFTLEFQKKTPHFTLEIYTPLGKRVWDQLYSNTTGKSVLVPVSLAAGTYILKVITEGTIHVQKITVSK